MKKFISVALLTLMIASCGGTPIATQTYESTDFTFNYPEGYAVKRAATRFVIEDKDAEKAITMYRYLAASPEEVITQMKTVDKNCKYSTGGLKFGGYKSYTIAIDESVKDAVCDLEGNLITNGDGIMVLFIENKSDEDLVSVLKDSFEFVN